MNKNESYYINQDNINNKIFNLYNLLPNTRIAAISQALKNYISNK